MPRTNTFYDTVTILAAPRRRGRRVLRKARQYFESVGKTVEAGPLRLCSDVACESPLFEGIAHKVSKSCANLVMTSPVGERSECRLPVSDSDRQLMRTRPVPRTLVGRHAWKSPPRFAASLFGTC